MQTPMIDVREAVALFTGDSITANWRRAQENRNVGVSGETSAFIARRFAENLGNSRPSYVHILAGTNDFRQGLVKDAADFKTVYANIDSMVVLAKARSIPVIVGTIPPLSFSLFPTLAPLIAPFNDGLKTHMRPQGVYIADYYKAMILPDGKQNSALFSDGIHPNEAGYSVMNGVLDQTLARMQRHEQRQSGRRTGDGQKREHHGQRKK